MKIGILLHFDPTTGTIKSELLFLEKLLKLLNPSSVTLIKGMQRADKLLSNYDIGYSYNVVEITNRAEYDAIIAWNSTNMSNFFGGMLSNSNIKYYDFISYYTHKNIPILYRSGDSENEIYDYRKLALERVENEASKEKTKFYDSNKESLEQLKAIVPINYDSYFLLVNGERDKFDWVRDTYKVRKPHDYFSNKMINQALYLGDDLFFQVTEKFDKTELTSSATIDSMFWIGFIENRNAGRKKIFTKLFKDAGNISEKMTIQSNTEFKLAGVNTINLEVEGDTQEYFQLLSNYRAYVFIGKGTNKCAYINKTVYDCFIARLPVFVYELCDQTGMVFADIPECRFSTVAELEALYTKCENTNYRNELVIKQQNSIKSRLNFNDTFRLQDMFKDILRETKKVKLLEF